MDGVVWTLDEVVDRGIAFLRAGQSPDGMWRDFQTAAGQSADWVTGFVAYCITQARPGEAVVGASVKALSARQRLNGGWGYNEAVPADCDSTAWALLDLTSGLECEPDVIFRAVNFILGHQPEFQGGGFCTYVPSDKIDGFMRAPDAAAITGWTHAHPCVTSVAIQALLASGKPASDHSIKIALDYLASVRAGEGLWPSYWWNGYAYSTFHAVRAIGAAGRPIAPAVVHYMASQQLTCGAWGSNQAGNVVPSAFETAFILLTLAQCEHQPSSPMIDDALQWLISTQNQDGSWPSLPVLRIPPPAMTNPDQRRRWRVSNKGTGVMVADEGRLFTTAAVLWALAGCRSMT